MSWSRKGNFFIARRSLILRKKAPGEFEELDEQDVSFYNENLSSTLNKIHVTYVYQVKNPNSGYFTIKLFPSIFNFQLFQNAFHIFFPHEKIVDEMVTIRMTTENLIKLNNLFDVLNQKLNREEFDKQIRDELNNLLNFKLHIFHSHIIKEKVTRLINKTQSHINPEKKVTDDLHHLIYKLNGTKKEYLKNLKKILVKGADSTDPKIYIYALLAPDPDILKFILRYTGIHYTRQRLDKIWSGTYESPIEIAMRFHKSDHFKLMTATKIPRNIGDNREKLLITHCTIAKDVRGVITRFEFNNNKVIITHLIPISEFHHSRNKETLDEVLNLFANTFEDPNGDKMKVVDAFFHDFSPHKKQWVEIIFEKESHKKKVIGCNLFGILDLKMDNEHIVFSPIYSFIRADLRGYKLMSFLAFRLPFVLQRMMPHKKVAIYYSALSSSTSIDMAKDFAHYPMLQPEHITKLLNDIFKVYYGNDFKYHHDDTMTFYFKEPIPLKLKQHVAENKADTFNQQEIFGSQEYVAGPVFFYITDDSINTFSIKLQEIGIEFESHIQCMQPALRKLMPEFNSNHPCQSLPCGQDLFWKNKLQPSKQPMPYHGLRSKL